MPWTVDQYRLRAAVEPHRHAGIGAASPDQDGFIAWLTLPISSERLSDPPSREMAEAVARSNASVLAFLSQEVELAAMPRTADDRLATALAPLRTRLDMVIEMVARLAYRDIALPPIVPVALSPSRIIWHSRQHWGHGDWLRLELYVHPIFREAVSLLLQVTDCTESEREEPWQVEGSLIEMPESTRDEMTRLAFLTHRRQQAWRRPRNWAAGER